MGNQIGTCLGCLPDEQPCLECNATGVCIECKGVGHLGIRDKQVVKTEMRKTPQGNMVPEVLTVVRQETVTCERCGGYGPHFRGNMASISANYAKMSSPTKGSIGSGKCIKCKGTGVVSRQVSGLNRRLF